MQPDIFTGIQEMKFVIEILLLVASSECSLKAQLGKKIQIHHVLQGLTWQWAPAV